MRLLRAAEGRLARDPVTQKPLACEGEWKPLNTYWRRRLQDGDVVEAPGSLKVKDKSKEKTKPGTGGADG